MNVTRGDQKEIQFQPDSAVIRAERSNLNVTRDDQIEIQFQPDSAVISAERSSLNVTRGDQMERGFLPSFLSRIVRNATKEKKQYTVWELCAHAALQPRGAESDLICFGGTAGVRAHARHETLNSGNTMILDILETRLHDKHDGP